MSFGTINCILLTQRNTLITSYGISGRVEDAFKFADEMERRGIKPNSVTWATLATACGKQETTDQAHLLLRRLKDNKVPTSDIPWVLMFSAAAKGSDLPFGKYTTKRP